MGRILCPSMYGNSHIVRQKTRPTHVVQARNIGGFWLQSSLKACFLEPRSPRVLGQKDEGSEQSPSEIGTADCQKELQTPCLRQDRLCTARPTAMLGVPLVWEKLLAAYGDRLMQSRKIINTRVYYAPLIPCMVIVQHKARPSANCLRLHTLRLQLHKQQLLWIVKMDLYFELVGAPGTVGTTRGAASEEQCRSYVRSLECCHGAPDGPKKVLYVYTLGQQVVSSIL